MSPAPRVVTVAEVQTLCQRVRSAGSPKAKARPPLVNQYTAMAEALGVAPSRCRPASTCSGPPRRCCAPPPSPRPPPHRRRPPACAARGDLSADLSAGHASSGSPRRPVVICPLARPRTGVVDLWQQGSALQ